MEETIFSEKIRKDGAYYVRFSFSNLDKEWKDTVGDVLFDVSYQDYII
jgi:hypothetical protein